jgi:hypothetical protein
VIRTESGAFTWYFGVIKYEFRAISPEDARRLETDNNVFINRRKQLLHMENAKSKN